MFTVVCISETGSVHRFDRRNIDDAREKLDECEASSIFASGSIFDEDDEEHEGFAREYDQLDDDRDQELPVEYSRHHDWSRHDFESDPDWR